MNLLKCLCIGLSSVLLAGIAVSPVSAATEGVPEYLLVSCNSSWTGVRCDHTTVPHDQSNGGLIDGKNLCIEGDHIGYADSGDIFCIGTVDFGDGAYNTIAMTASNTDSGGGTVKVFLDMDPESLAPEFTGQEICSIPITKSGGWSNFVEMTGSIAERVTGKHKVYILLGGSINVRSFGFSYSNAVPDRITIPCNSSWTGVRCEHHNNPGDMNNGGLIEGSNLQIEGDHIGWADAGDIFCIGEVEFGEAAYAVASMSASNPSNEEDRFTETGKPITDPSGNPCTVDLYIDMDENSATPEKTGTKIASIPVIASGGWATYINMDGKLSSVSGTHKASNCNGTPQ